jgi:hypothetical protein
MKMLRLHKVAGLVCLLILSMLCTEVFAQPAEQAEPAKRTQPARSRRGSGMYGDWDVKMSYNGTEYTTILSFSRNKEGKLTGNWVSLWGMNELKDIKFADGNLSFARTSRGRNGESSTSKFVGTLKDGIISGTVSSSRGNNKLEGKRSKRTARALGSWTVKMKPKGGGKEFMSTLVITVDKEGKLQAKEQGERGEYTITDIKYERGKLSFKRKRITPKPEQESTFEGNIRRDTLNGVFKSESGELKAEGKRIGKLAIGKWNLDIESERGKRKQRLQVNPDMSGMYGSLAIKKIILEGDKVSFKTTMSFGDRKFEMSFAGTIKENKLTGELKTSRGSQKIKGTKVVRPTRRRSR